MTDIPLCSFDGVEWLPRGKFLAEDVATGFGVSMKTLGTRIRLLRRQGFWKHEDHYHRAANGRSRRALYIHEIRELEGRWRDVRFRPELICTPDHAGEPDPTQLDLEAPDYESRLKRLQVLQEYSEAGYIPSDVLEWATHTHRDLLARMWESRRDASLRTGKPFHGLRLLGWYASPFQLIQDEFWWQIRRTDEPYEDSGLLGRLTSVPTMVVDRRDDLKVEPDSVLKRRLRERAIGFLRALERDHGYATVELCRRLSTSVEVTMDVLETLEREQLIYRSNEAENVKPSNIVWFFNWDRY
jgi:hypothetical protein